MPIVVIVLEWLLQILFWLFIARFVLDLVISVNPRFRPRGVLLPLLEITMTITDVPLRAIRKVIRPVRIGSVQLDFSWTVVLLLISVLQSLVARLG